MSQQNRNQQLVVGVFASKATFEAAATKIKDAEPKLLELNASDMLVISKDEQDEVHVDTIDIDSKSDVDVMGLATRVAAGVSAVAGNAPSDPTELSNQATHLGLALNPGAVAVAVFVDEAFAAKVEEGIASTGALIITTDALARIGAGLGAAHGANDLGSMAGEAPAAALSATPAVFDWQAEYAYSLGLQALIYGFPYVLNAVTRFKWTNIPQDPDHVPYSAVNKFWHGKQVIDATYRDGGCPNNDTAYSLAWVDLSDGPVILSIPEIEPGRYWTMEMFEFMSNNFAYLGMRYDTKPGHYAVVGPNWQGELPEGVTRVTPNAPTPSIAIFGRTVVNGLDDLPAVHAIQAGYKLTPLSYWGRPEEQIPDRRDVYKPPVKPFGIDDPLGPWKTLNAMLAENPPPAHHDILLKQFANIGIGPGLDVEEQPEPVKQGLQRAAGAGMLILRQQFASGIWAKVINGWRYPGPEMGRYGDDFLKRAADQSLAGITANDPEEAVYLVTSVDDQGEPLTGAHKYELTFPAGMEPPVDSFWSLIAYGTDYNLIPNPINRYSVGDRTLGVTKNADGSTTFYFQNESPGPDKASNWLPTGSDPWFPIMRLYIPRPEVLNATWECPPIKRVD